MKETLGSVVRKEHPVYRAYVTGDDNLGQPDLRQIRSGAVALAFALVALNVLDLVATRLTVGRMGAVEMNPLIAPIIATPWAIVLKVGLPIGIVLLAAHVRRCAGVRALRIAVAAYMVVAIIGVGQIAFVLVR